MTSPDPTIKRVVFFDVETSGTDPKKHQIIQLGAVVGDLNLGGCAGNEFIEREALSVRLLFDESKADPAALEKNHYDPLLWEAEAISQHRGQIAMTNLLRRHQTVKMISQRNKRPYYVAQLGGHNAASFDHEFLRELYGAEWLPASFRVLDTLHLAQWVHLFDPNPPENYQLATLCAHHGVPLENAHDALCDVRATAQLAGKLSSLLMVP